VWLCPLGPETDARIESAWHGLTEGTKPRAETIEMKGRQVPVPAAARGAARFSFADLCERPLGASDYLAIAERYSTIFVEHIPVLGPDRGNETKRFINLIDTLYDGHRRLVASAAAMPEDLLPVRKGTTGFEFDRTVSRLFEMRSQDYVDSCE
jgi:cell division protein ZapE